MVFLFLIIIVIGVFIWQFKRLKRRKVTKRKAISFLPAIRFFP
jgi:flagellar biogenesis protein FliO